MVDSIAILCSSLLSLIFSIGAASAAISAPASSPAKPWMHTETRLRLVTTAFRGIGDRTPQELAKDFPMVICNATPDPKALHEGNPDCKVFKYFLGPYVGKSEMEKLPPEAMAHDKDGKVTKAREWENWLVQPDSPQWIEYVVGMSTKFFDKGFDGIYTDSMGTAPLGVYLYSRPINPQTGKEYTPQEWLAAESKMAEAIREKFPKDKILIMNGLGPGSRYWAEPEAASPRALLKYYDGALSESTFRSARQKLTEWPNEKDWMADLRMIQDVQKRGIMGYWYAKTWGDGNTSNDEPNAKELVPQWRRFALASYLLSAGPDSYFMFDTRKNDKNGAEYFPEYDAPLGIAVEEMQKSQSGIYFRHYKNGLTIVNPSDKQAADVSIPGTKNKIYVNWGIYKKSASQPTGSIVHGKAEEFEVIKFPATIPAHSGMILTLRD